MFEILSLCIFTHFQITKENEDKVVETGSNKEECISVSIVCQDEIKISKDAPLENVHSLEESVYNRIDLTSQNPESNENVCHDKIENADTKSAVYNTPQACPSNEEQTEIPTATNVTNSNGNILRKIIYIVYKR